MTRSTRLLRLFFWGISLSILILGSQASATLINGSFENGMTGWTTVGPNSAVPNGTINGYSATDGTNYAYIHNGVGAQPVFILDFVLNSIGIGPNFISTNYPTATSGALLFQTFTLDVGCNELLFDWNFLTNESQNSNNDFAFAWLFPTTNNAVLDTNSSFPGSTSPDYLQSTDWQTVSFPGLTGGNNYTLVFGVFDVNDFVVDSALLVDNVRCIPEPGAGILVAMAGLAALRRRRVV